MSPGGAEPGREVRRAEHRRAHHGHAAEPLDRDLVARRLRFQLVLLGAQEGQLSLQVADGLGLVVTVGSLVAELGVEPGDLVLATLTCTDSRSACSSALLLSLVIPPRRQVPVSSGPNVAPFG